MAKKQITKIIAVENFVGTIDPAFPMQTHLANLYLDANSYKWNQKTVNAIKKGIRLIYRESYTPGQAVDRLVQEARCADDEDTCRGETMAYGEVF